MESTGNYHLRCAFALFDNSRHVSVENPLAVKRHIQSNLKCSKNDKSDAFSLVKYGTEKIFLHGFLHPKVPYELDIS